MRFNMLGPLAALDRRSAWSWLFLRILLSGFIAAHGWARFLVGGVVPFGDWLTAQHVPAGLLVAAAITILEIVGTPLLLLGLGVFPLSLVYAAIYTAGLLMVHLPAGWFVVGLGRNGAEYSALLITCIVLVGLQHRRRNPAAEGESHSDR